MALTTGVKVPTNTIKVGHGPHHEILLTAEGAITPGEFVKFGTDAARVVVCAADDVACIGIADLNYDAVLEDLDPLTHAFAADDRVPVILTGMAVITADTAGITAGLVVRVGAADGGEGQTLAADADIRLCKGRALTTAATTVKAVMLLGAL